MQAGDHRLIPMANEAAAVAMRVLIRSLSAARRSARPAASRIAVGLLLCLLSASAMPHITSGRLRALGVTGATRVPQLPQVPTFAQGGVPGYEFTAFYALLLPGKTPREIVARFADTIAKVVASPDYRERIVNAGMEPASNTPEQMLELAQQDGAHIDKIIRTANIRLE